MAVRDISKRIFRRMPQAELQKPQGEPVKGRGILVRLKAETGGHTAGERHVLGELCHPLFVFTGDLGADPGDVLTQDGQLYTVLKAEPMALSGLRLGMRLTLERREVEDDDGA